MYQNEPKSDTTLLLDLFANSQIAPKALPTKNFPQLVLSCILQPSGLRDLHGHQWQDKKAEYNGQQKADTAQHVLLSTSIHVLRSIKHLQ